MKTTLLLSILLLVGLSKSADVYQAIASMHDSAGTGIITGTVTFTSDAANPDAGSSVHVNIMGIPNDGLHGIHIHQYGDVRGFLAAVPAGSAVKGPLSVGDHFNPTGMAHGCPDNATHHLGDLGNWNVTGGRINETKQFSYVFLHSNNSVIGRTIVLHNATDNCELVSSSGGRIAVGVIGIANPVNDTNIAGSEADVNKAVCVFQGTGNCVSNCEFGKGGYVILTASNGNSSNITIDAQIYGLQAQRGFHIHWYGVLTSDDGTAAGGHYNPIGYQHGLPTVNNDRHSGDLGSIIAFDSVDGFYRYAPTYPNVTGWTLGHLVGRAFILHADIDHGRAPDCAQGTTTGNAGNRNLICVIGVANPDAALPSPSPTTVTFSNTWQELSCNAPPPPINPQPVPVTPPPTPTSGASVNTIAMFYVFVLVLAFIF